MIYSIMRAALRQGGRADLSSASAKLKLRQVDVFCLSTLHFDLCGSSPEKKPGRVTVKPKIVTP
ncbi:MAG: hypothetical protein BVN35_16310 [Proteobacteria bacterium ST_bin11]|nr:MAG: hypothetical protein BVN35_16310 [Proteobacteria bacterium ST_bin11]